MRKVILDLAVTLDGFIESVNGEIDWCIMDDDMDFDGFLDKGKLFLSHATADSATNAFCSYPPAISCKHFS